MLTPLEIAGIIIALVAAVCAAMFLQRFIGGVEDTMSDMHAEERDDTPVRTSKAVRPPATRSKRRR